MHDASARTGAGELPFWQQLPQVLLYPLHAVVLLSTAALALFSVLIALPGLVGMILLAVTWLATYGYAFEILRRSAHGSAQPPERPGELFDDGVLRLIALMALSGLALMLCGHLLGPLPMLALALLLFCLHPIWLISLALDGSMTLALNPATAVRTLQRIAGPYAVALLMLATLQAGAGLLLALAHTALPAPLAWPLSTAGYAYALFAGFRLLGVMVHSYRDRLGFEADAGSIDATAPTPERPPGPAERAGQQLLGRVQQLLQDGRDETARQLLEQAVRSGHAGDAVHRQLQALLACAPRARRHAHLGLWLAQLADAQPVQALALWRQALGEDADFAPAQEDTGDRLVQLALQRSQRQLAHDGLRALLRRWPQSPQLASRALQAAQLASDLHGDTTAARELIAQGLAASPSAELQRRLDAALAALPAAL